MLMRNSILLNSVINGGRFLGLWVCITLFVVCMIRFCRFVFSGRKITEGIRFILCTCARCCV